MSSLETTYIRPNPLVPPTLPKVLPTGREDPRRPAVVPDARRGQADPGRRRHASPYMPRRNDAPDPYDSEKTRQLLNMVQRWMHDMDRQCEAYLNHNASPAQYALPFLGALPVQHTSFETMRTLLLEEFQNQIMREIKNFRPVIHDRHPRRHPEPPAAQLAARGTKERA
jgi:hypothetical protein